MGSNLQQQQHQIAKDLFREQSRDDPDPEVCRVLLERLAVVVCDDDGAADRKKLLAACQKTFRLQRRRSAASNSIERQQWDELLALVKEKRMVDQQASTKQTTDDANDEDEEETNERGDDEGLPGTVSQYLRRLQKHNKDLHKNPPALPPGAVTVYETRAPLPKRDQTTRRLSFPSNRDADQETAKLIKEFRPNTTPEEVLRGGAFGGTYFRPIHSAVTNRFYKASEVLHDSVPPEWIAGLDKKEFLTNTKYNAAVNKFNVKCGGSLGMWESSGWISDADPYGWFQWYCRFYQGRRCSDDARQIRRWLGVAGLKGRFKSQLCNKILAAGGISHINDASISPVIRQSLFHWGLQITSDVLEKHKRR